MSKKNRTPKADQAAQTETQTTAAPQQTEAKPVVYYTVVAPKRPLTGTKFGVSGNAYTHNKLCEAANAKENKCLTYDEVLKVCADANHRSFAAYALNRLKILVPATTPSAQ